MMMRRTFIVMVVDSLVHGMVKQLSNYKLMSCDNPSLLVLRVRLLTIMYFHNIYKILCTHMIVDTMEDGKENHFLDMERFLAFGVLTTWLLPAFPMEAVVFSLHKIYKFHPIWK